MDMRTDDLELFGSYHPNDLVQAIVDFFKKGGHTSQWGMVVYNPNNAVNQYMGTLNTAGTLGPQSPSNQENPYGTVRMQDQGTALFNPSELNERLMQSAQNLAGNYYINSEGQSSMKTTDGSSGTSMSFDPDHLNQKLMQDLIETSKESHVPESGPTPTTENDSTSKDTANGTADSQENADIKPRPEHDFSGFNPDVLNAELFSSLKYGSESANVMYQGSSVVPERFSQGSQVSTITEKESNAKVGETKVITSGEYNKGSPRNSTGNFTKDYTGFQTFVGTGFDGSMAEQIASLQNASTLQSSAFSGIPAGIIPSTLTVPSPDLSQMSAPLTMTGASTDNSTTSFQPGGLGQEGFKGLNSSGPPGVSGNFIGQQTDVAMTDVHGIGSLG